MLFTGGSELAGGAWCGGGGGGPKVGGGGVMSAGSPEPSCLKAVQLPSQPAACLCEGGLRTKIWVMIKMSRPWLPSLQGAENVNFVKLKVRTKQG